MIRADHRSRSHIQGGVLLELLLAIAVFAGAAAFALASVKSVFSALDRSRREQALIDMARSRMAEVEAGIITLADLRESAEAPLAAESLTANQQLNAGENNTDSSNVKIETTTTRTEFTGLSLVEIKVTESSPDGSVPEDALSYTLRQLLPVGGG